MKVLKEGKWNVPWTGECVCSTCEATLLVEEKDVIPTRDCNGKFHCCCCVCGHQLVLSPQVLPRRLTEELEKKREYTPQYVSDW